MTSNQISASATEETARHNVAVEELNTRAQAETERHNQVLERLEDQKQRLQDQYNRTYLRIQESQGKKKLELEESLQNLNARIAENEYAIANRKNVLQEALNEIQREKNTLTRDYNNSMVDYYKRIATAQEQTVTTEQKRAINDMNRTNLQIMQTQFENEFNTKKLEIDTNLRLKELKIKQTDTIWKNINNSVTNVLKSVPVLGNLLQ